MIWADLHCHTTCSDGTLTARELVLHAQEVGLRGLSITDHDTISAYPEAIEAAKKVGIRLGTGIEFSCHFEGQSLHLLGYDFVLDHPAIAKLCQRHHLRRQQRNQAILDKLKEQGIQISYEELKGASLVPDHKSLCQDLRPDFSAEHSAERAGIFEQAVKRERAAQQNKDGSKIDKDFCGRALGRPHIAQRMVEKGVVKNPREAFHKYIGEGKPCYVRGEPFDPQEAIEVIHLAGGKAFLAHPHLLPGSMAIDRLLQFSWDGIECYYAKICEKSWLHIAKERSLMTSGGSDFHGGLKPDIELGCNGVDQMTFERIFTRWM